ALKAPHGETHGAEDILDICEQNHVPLIPFFSILTAHKKKDNRVAEVASKYNATEAQINIAWLLHRSPWILPIPGTSSLKHFQENIKAVNIELTQEDMDYLD
ncbi:MAG TPA: aldo/keto reductase, partial [Parafilimonas sp.]|nr:aldo/keto reductase [Parafilimonas sp.]